MARDEKKDDLESKVIYEYGDGIGFIEELNISETFDEPLLLAAGCFHPNTLIKMKDGTQKKIRDLLLGDELYMGGKVYMKMEAISNDLYEYRGTQVAGSHTVYQNGKWIQVQEAEGASPIEGSHTIINLGTDEHMIVTKSGTIFADYYLTNKHMDVEKQLIDLINQEKDEKFMARNFDLAN